MTANDTDSKSGTYEADGRSGSSPRQRAIDAYSTARDSISDAGRRATDTLNEAPLIALAGGIAAGALIAALLPRTEAETRAVRPTARRVRKSAREAVRAAKETGSERLNNLGLTREKGEETIRALLKDVTEAARESGRAALDKSRDR
jgi:hypothetical protein